MTVRYFEAHDPPIGLARVDLDPANPIAQVLNPNDGWVDMPSLFKVALFYGEAWQWDEIAPEVAAARAKEVTGDDGFVVNLDDRG